MFRRHSLSIALLVALASSAAQAQVADPILQPDITIAGINVGGLTASEAKLQLRLWWENERRQMVSLTSPKFKVQPEPRSLTSWGLSLDDSGTIQSLPKEAFINSGLPTGSLVAKDFVPVIKFDSSKFDSLERFMFSQLGRGEAATQLTIVGGKLTVKGGKPAPKLDRKATAESLMQAYKSGALMGSIAIDAPASDLPEQGLTLVEVARYTTRYPTGQKSRNNNLGLASGKIDGTVLMPGEVFSFNDTVGRRTAQAGFKEAGVYVNGRHDTGIGGGICQVSTTLYNASLMADLGIVHRRNHSMPVAYVPVGRDATVSYGTIDLKLKNPYDFPIAFKRIFGKGSLTFVVYGQPTGKTVKILLGKRTSWTPPAKTVYDSKLRPGSRRVIEKGSNGHRIVTYRQVFAGGKLVRKDNLGLSYYTGGSRITAVGRSRPRATPVVKSPMAPPTTTVTPTPGAPIVPRRRVG